MAMQALTGALTQGFMGGQQASPGTPKTPGASQQPAPQDPLTALIKKHLMGPPPPPAPIQPAQPANPGYDNSSGGTA